MIQPFDQSIPVLTEIVTEAGEEPAPQTPAPVEAQAEPDADAIGAQLETLATDSWTEPEWYLLEQRVSERILQQLDARVDETLDRQLRDSLAGVLQEALAGLTEDLRTGLHKAIEQTVALAVAKELARLHPPKRR